MSNFQVPAILLNDGRSIPQLGIGTWQLGDADADRVISAALDLGYRSIDTAAAYRNEASIGRAIAASGIPRDQLFVTTKLWKTDLGRNQVMGAFQRSLDRLGLDYVDLYLIHWPAPARGLYVETWEELIKLSAAGRARSIGVSNFQPHHIRRLVTETSSTPAVNQIEVHPGLPQWSMHLTNLGFGIATQAWSPLANGAVLSNPLLVDLANGLCISPAQLILRWHLQRGIIVNPKSTSAAHLSANMDAASLPALTAEQWSIIAAVETGKRLGPDPERFN